MAPITRVTMIKIKEEDIEIALKGFEIFTKTQKKVRSLQYMNSVGKDAQIRYRMASRIFCPWRQAPQEAQSWSKAILLSRNLCLRAWMIRNSTKTYALLTTSTRCSWKTMPLHRDYYLSTSSPASASRFEHPPTNSRPYIDLCRFQRYWTNPPFYSHWGFSLIHSLLLSQWLVWQNTLMRSIWQ